MDTYINGHRCRCAWCAGLETQTTFYLVETHPTFYLVANMAAKADWLTSMGLAAAASKEQAGKLTFCACHSLPQFASSILVLGNSTPDSASCDGKMQAAGPTCSGRGLAGRGAVRAEGQLRGVQLRGKRWASRPKRGGHFLQGWQGGMADEGRF